MAIAFDAETSTTGSADPAVMSHTNGTDARILFVGFSYPDARTVSSATYGGQAMTEIGSVDTGGGGKVKFYMLATPPTGANNVSIEMDNTGTWRMAAASYKGGEAISQPDATGGNGFTTDTTRSHTLTSIADNCWHVMYADHNPQTVSAGASTTKRTTGTTTFGIFDGNAVITPAGSNTIISTSSSSTIIQAGASFILTPVNGTASPAVLDAASSIPGVTATGDGNVTVGSSLDAASSVNSPTASAAAHEWSNVQKSS